MINLSFYWEYSGSFSVIGKKMLAKRLFISALVASVFLLGGCSKAPKPTPGWSKEKLRQYYAKALTNEGAAVIELGQTVRVVIPSDNLFTTDSANIAFCHQDILNNAANFIKTYTVSDLQVAAYSDNDPLPGPQGRRDALTTRRAQVFTSFLWARGINARFAYAEGRGAKDPIGWNTTVRGRYFNRRIEVTFRFYPKEIRYN